MKTKYELHEGIFGNGSKKYMVVAVGQNGQWLFTHEFKTEAEAKCWMKWA